jgi:hypothetical protein
VLVIKSRRIEWDGQVVHIREGKGYTGFWCRNQTEINHWEDLSVDGWIILG